jgi:hypothetical protein
VEIHAYLLVGSSFVRFIGAKKYTEVVMPNISASDYTSFIKAQAASYAYRNGAIPKTIQTSAQPFTTQTVLNAQLLASKAAVLTSSIPPPVPVNLLPGSSTLTLMTQTPTSLGSTFTKVGGTASTWDSAFYSAAPLAATSVVPVVMSGGVGSTSVNGSFGFSTVTTPLGAAYVKYGWNFSAPSTIYYLNNGSSIGTGGLGYLPTDVFSVTYDGTNVLYYKNGALQYTVAATLTPLYGVGLLYNNGDTLTRMNFSQTSTIRTTPTLARVVPYNGRGYVNQPKSLSTVHNSTSTTQSSGKFPQLGGLPLTAPKWDGVYAPVAHLARVDTKATGAYQSVRQPV